jgi:hypothetical protein
MASMSLEYSKARDAMRAANAAFDKVTRAYRARQIGDAEYLAARRVWEAAEDVFDAAYAAEESR